MRQLSAVVALCSAAGAASAGSGARAPPPRAAASAQSVFDRDPSSPVAPSSVALIRSVPFDGKCQCPHKMLALDAVVSVRVKVF